jgi:hypothetical protein
MRTTVACASGLVVKAAHNMFGRRTSAAYVVRPLTLARPSTRTSSVWNRPAMRLDPATVEVIILSQYGACGSSAARQTDFLCRTPRPYADAARE